MADTATASPSRPRHPHWAYIPEKSLSAELYWKRRRGEDIVTVQAVSPWWKVWGERRYFIVWFSESDRYV